MNKAEILIIDDEPQIRKLLEINLESNGYKVWQAETGKEGVLMAANHPPELILLDIGLPDRSGHEVLKDLNKDILRMGAYAEEAIYRSIESLKNRDKEMAQNVITNDNKVDELELAIDEKCIDLIATHQPMAKDLRFITTGMKLNTELERIAVIAVDIAQRVLETTVRHVRHSLAPPR